MNPSRREFLAAAVVAASAAAWLLARIPESPLPGWDSGNCIGWEEVVTATRRAAGASFPGDAVVLDDLCDVVAPLTAVALTQHGASSVKLVTRWPMVGL